MKSPTHNDVRSQHYYPGLEEALHSALLFRPSLRHLVLIRSNVIKSALARAYVAMSSEHSEQARRVNVVDVMDGASALQGLKL